MSSEDGAGLVRRAVEEIWNQGRLEVADRLFTADYVNHGGLIPDLVRGPEAVKIAVALFRTAYPEIQVTVRRVRVDGTMVVLHWVAHAAAADHPGADCARQPADSLEGVTRGRIIGGQIAESWTHWDQARTLRRLGLAGSAGVETSESGLR